MLGSVGATKSTLGNLVQKLVLPNSLSYVHFPRAVVLSALEGIGESIMSLIDFYSPSTISACTSVGVNILHHRTVCSLNDGSTGTGMNFENLVEIFIHSVRYSF